MAKAKSARLSCQERISRAAQIVRTSSFVREAAIGRRHHRLEPAGVAQGADQRAAGSIDVGVIDVLADLFAGPIRQRRGEATVLVGEERPIEVIKRRHQRSPTCAASPLSRSMKRWIFPVAVFGRLSTNSIQRGYFHGPIARFTCTLSSS